MENGREIFTNHLEELRRRVLVGLAAVGSAAALAYLFSAQILGFLLAPLHDAGVHAVFFAPADAFLVRFNTALLSGLIAASPVVFYELFRFVSPGLYPHEKRAVLPLAFAASALFVTGCVFAFFAVVPFTLQFLLGYATPDLRPQISVTQYLSFVSTLVLSFGLAFNLPVLIIGLAWMGVVDAAFLARYRPHAVVLIFIAAAVLTPPDVLSQIVLAVPMVLLYEASLLGARVVGRKKSGLFLRKKA